MTGGVDEVQHIYIPVRRAVIELYGARLYRYAALALEVHVVEQLLLHVALSDSARVFEYAVGKRRLAVVDVCDY